MSQFVVFPTRFQRKGTQEVLYLHQIVVALSVRWRRAAMEVRNAAACKEIAFRPLATHLQISNLHPLNILKIN